MTEVLVAVAKLLAHYYLLTAPLVFLLVIFVTLKISGAIGWSWWLALAPLYPIVIFGVGFGLFMLLAWLSGAGVQ